MSKFGVCLFTQAFIDLHDKENSGKFPVGTVVRYISPKFLTGPNWNFIGCDFVVLSSHDTGGGVEYLLEGFPWLVWEEEICSTLGLERTEICKN